MEKTFSEFKKRRLNKIDLSKKGNVDEDIVHLVDLLNTCEQYFTTSSCSGRITVIDGAPESCVVQKRNLVLLFVSHKECKFDDVMSALVSSCGNAVLKFEPFILHLQCRTLGDAQLMAIRSTHSLEVPLSHQGKLLVSHEYLEFLIGIANQKMGDNLRRIQRFYQTLKTTVISKDHQKLPSKEEMRVTKNNKSIVSEQRQKLRGIINDCHTDGGSSIIEMDEELHLAKWLNDVV
ncbi:tRNA wybutosine-synthesizing protein 3 homolog isoform X2 [Syngnathoides biaculeatus]|uniref:tRNA wybutosine-synthesizing protein 3 homolog isoform X2 n=1 Tax=Syngnathoides biaculeatus TaxID=300417 RepID=UPI002ADDD32E|nr:tRNA wybutosine-synthesizing protein 3 homolog isoform X2 [Syngnathoides biaculeatus]